MTTYKLLHIFLYIYVRGAIGIYKAIIYRPHPFAIIPTHTQYTYKWSFCPHTVIQWNILSQHTVQSSTIE